MDEVLNETAKSEQHKLTTEQLYMFDYAASRYEEHSMIAFQNLFKRVIAVIVSIDNTDGYAFKQLKKHVCDKKIFYRN